MKHRVIGIDFGTLYSSVAVYDPETRRAVCFPDRGRRRIPSTIAPADAGGACAGIEPEKAAGCITGVKACLGVADPPGALLFGPDGICLLPEEATALLFLHLKALAEDDAGEEIRDAVLTLPAAFTAPRREALERASLLAGLYPRLLLRDTAAAAFAYAAEFSFPSPHPVLVFHLGAATAEAAVIEIEHEKVTTVAVAGDERIGKARAAALPDLINRCWAMVEEALNRATARGVPREAIRAAVLAGGGTRLPAIRAALLERLGRPESFIRFAGDEESIARGAAYAGRSLKPSPPPFQIRFGRQPAGAAGDLESARARLLVMFRPAGEMFEPGPQHLRVRSGPRSAAARPAAPRRSASDFHFSAFYPERIGAADVGRILAYAHLAEAAGRVAQEAASRLDLPPGVRLQAASEASRVALPKDAVIDVTAEAPGLAFETSRASLHLWEDMQAVEFRFKPEPGAARSVCRGWIRFWLHAIIVAEVEIAIHIAEDRVPDLFREHLAKANSRPYRSVFPSYSHADAMVVERVEAYASCFGDEYIRDVTTLRTGQVWSERLLEFIERADVFQLFWSERAAASRYVENEWRHALKERRKRSDPFFVRPVYWSRQPARIPSALEPLHFAHLDLGPR